MNYISYHKLSDWLSDLELLELENKLAAKGYVRLPDREEFAVFKFSPADEA